MPTHGISINHAPTKLFNLMSALASKVNIFAVCAQSVIGALNFTGERGGGESCKIRPPGPLGTDHKDFPRNRTAPGIPEVQAPVTSSMFASAPNFNFCKLVNLPMHCHKEMNVIIHWILHKYYINRIDINILQNWKQIELCYLRENIFIFSF